MAISEQELDEKRQRNEKLRAQVAAEQAKQTTREAEIANEVVSTQLDAEAVRLEAALAAAKEGNKVAAVRAGVDAPLGAAKDELALAEHHLKAEDDRREEQARLVAEAKETEAREAAEAKEAREKAEADAKAAREKAEADAAAATKNTEKNGS